MPSVVNGNNAMSLIIEQRLTATDLSNSLSRGMGRIRTILKCRRPRRRKSSWNTARLSVAFKKLYGAHITRNILACFL